MQNWEDKIENLEDKLLVCVDCGIEFPFTKGEQEFFLARGLHETKRCAECRLQRKLTARQRWEVGAEDN